MLFLAENIVTVYTPDGDQPDTTTGQTALEEIYNQPDLSRAFVTRSNRYYRWYATATNTPDGESVVIPRGWVPGTQPGRWLREGPPGQGGNRLPRGATSAVGRVHLLAQLEFALTGGAQTEIHIITMSTPNFLFDQSTAFATAVAGPLANNLSNAGYLATCVVRNNRIRLDVDNTLIGANIEAGAPAMISVWEKDNRIAQPAFSVA